MDEIPKLDRTWLCSVVFVDIVGYTRQFLEQQIIWKRRFNDYLAEAIKECPESDRVILDTGDGAAICFLGDPEMAMFCALRLLSALAQEETGQEHPMRARLGINLGSVKLVKDINGNLNAVGDGINVGQRVMSFANDNQILVSRSFYEVAIGLCESYGELFKDEGVRKDKHVREHTLYELHAPGTTGRGAAPSSTEFETAPMFDSAVLTKIENNLAPIVGPIARHLVKNASRQAASSSNCASRCSRFFRAKLTRESFCARVVLNQPPLQLLPLLRRRTLSERRRPSPGTQNCWTARAAILLFMLGQWRS